jgi:hypothetical protein
MVEDKRWNYKQTTLKKGVYSIMILMETGPIILDAAAIVSCYFIEDIFKNCMSGKLTFQDRYGMQELGGFSGNEKVIIVYGTGDKNRELMFDIWKVGKINQQTASGRTQESALIEITFIDTFFPNLNLKRYSRSFIQENTTDIIKWIINKIMLVEKTNMQLSMDDSNTKLDFVMPYWSPRIAINYLMKRSKSIKTGEGGYLYYHNTQDQKRSMQLNVKSINYLLADVDRTLDPVAYVMSSEDLTIPNKILEYTMTGLDRNSNAKIRGGSWKGYNFLRKKLIEQDLTYSEGIDRTILLGSTSLYGKIDDITSNISISGEPNQDLLKNVSYSEWTKRYNMQYIVTITVEGNEKRFAGQHIQIAWPSYLKQEKFNKALEGKYIIKSVTHHFGPGQNYQYMQKLVLIKNAYHRMNSSYLMQAINKNITQERQKAIVRI